MSDRLEFHDSTLREINVTEADVELLLDAYIHRWQQVNDEWAGTGWMQHVRVVLSQAIGRSAVPVLPVDISDGRLQLGPAAPDGLVPLPLHTSGVVRLWLQLTTADVIDLTGSAVRIEATAEARYVEELPADWRP